MYSWLRQKQDQVPPSTAVGKVIAVALGQWPKLIRFLDHALLTPDNNSCEQVIRPFVIGRNYAQFSTYSNTASRAWPRLRNLLRSSNSHSRVAKKLSHRALSHASPTEPIEGRTPACHPTRWWRRRLSWR